MISLTQRQKNIIRRMCAGEGYYSQGSPRMTRKEAQDLWDLGFHIQIESVHGADTSDGMCFYAMPGFNEKAKSLGVII
jgi:hypothetical protein